jgi:hypothetical protein
MRGTNIIDGEERTSNVVNNENGNREFRGGGNICFDRLRKATGRSPTNDFGQRDEHEYFH